MKHTWYECPKPCARPVCIFCDGGLSLCTVCGGAEGSLTTDCLGTQVDAFTLEKVYTTDLDFVNGSWVRATDLNTRMRGATVQQCRELYEAAVAQPSMLYWRALRGY